jgi:Fe-S-cluster containining protein
VSSSTKIRRPLWRSYSQRFIANAAAHVRAGGHALLWRPGPSSPVAWMLLPLDAEGDMPLMATWSMLALEKRRFDVVRRGPARGLATMRIPRDYETAVEGWCERDAMWPGATREIELDCVTCAACCRNNRVQLEPEDYALWRANDRKDLAGRAYTRRRDGQVLLRLRTDGACVHLQGALCDIYPLRPDACRVFPAGSEPCLESRREEFGANDGFEPNDGRYPQPRTDLADGHP